MGVTRLNDAAVENTNGDDKGGAAADEDDGYSEGDGAGDGDGGGESNGDGDGDGNGDGDDDGGDDIQPRVT